LFVFERYTPFSGSEQIHDKLPAAAGFFFNSCPGHLSCFCSQGNFSSSKNQHEHKNAFLIDLCVPHVVKKLINYVNKIAKLFLFSESIRNTK